MMKEKVEEPLSPMARLYQDPSMDCCIITMIGFKTKIELECILNDLKHNVSKHPRFCSKLSDNGARWIKIKVNVEDHVYAPEIDLQESKEDGERFVNDYVSRLTMIPFDKSRPLWDIHILNVKISDVEAVGVIRCHHSLGDGTSMMSLLVACTRKTSDPEAFPTIPTIKLREHFLSHHHRSKGYFIRSIFRTYYAVRLVWNTIVDVVQFLAVVLFLKDTETPLKKTGGFVENNARRFYHRTISLDDIRLIKNAMNMTINDVLLGVTQTALSCYLNGRYGNTDVESGISTSDSDMNNLPSRIRFRAGVPVNLRQEIGIKSLADMLAKGSKCRWGNYNGLLHFPLTISLETDPLVNLSKTKALMDRKKHSLMADFLYSNNRLLTNIFGPKVGVIFFKRSMLNTTTMFSNIIGPAEEVSLHGNQITYIAISCYGNMHLSQGFLFHFISYAEKMTISIAVDPTIIPDPHIIFDGMEKALKDIKDTLSGKFDPLFGSHH